MRCLRAHQAAWLSRVYQFLASPRLYTSASRWTYGPPKRAARHLPRCLSQQSRLVVPIRDDVPSALVAEEAKIAQLHALNCFYCKRCGSSMELAVPAGEEQLRHVCSNTSCGFIDYHNPKMVVGCVVEHEGKVLLCRRALEPCKGLWTLPAGFLELAETTEEGAKRETWEEACAKVDVFAPYAHLDIPVINQTYIFFRGELGAPYTFSPGVESLDVQLFDVDTIPFDDLAFSSIHTVLKRWIEDRARGTYSLHHGVIRKKPGASPRDPNAFEYQDSFAANWTHLNE